jgi:hypothetical protein
MRPKKFTTALSVLSLSLLGALLSGGCVENRTTLFITGVAAFSPGDQCDPDPSLTADFNVIGSYDPYPGLPYYAWLIVANGLQPRGENETLRPETSRIQLQGAEITISTITGAAAAPAFTINFAATIHPDDSEDPGLAVIPVPIIPPSLGLGYGEYQVAIKLFGESFGGNDVESGDFSFPVNVTNPGDMTVCESSASLNEDLIHPCGGLPQDGYVFPCGDYPTLGPCAALCNF